MALEPVPICEPSTYQRHRGRYFNRELCRHFQKCSDNNKNMSVLCEAHELFCLLKPCLFQIRFFLTNKMFRLFVLTPSCYNSCVYADYSNDEDATRKHWIRFTYISYHLRMCFDHVTSVCTLSHNTQVLVFNVRYLSGFFCMFVSLFLFLK